MVPFTISKIFLFGRSPHFLANLGVASPPFSQQIAAVSQALTYGAACRTLFVATVAHQGSAITRPAHS